MERTLSKLSIQDWYEFHENLRAHPIFLMLLHKNVNNWIPPNFTYFFFTIQEFILKVLVLQMRFLQRAFVRLQQRTIELT